MWLDRKIVAAAVNVGAIPHRMSKTQLDDRSISSPPPTGLIVASWRSYHGKGSDRWILNWVLENSVITFRDMCNGLLKRSPQRMLG